MEGLIGGLLPLFLEYVLPIMGTLIAAGVTWLLGRMEQKFGLQVEASHREALQEALTNAAGLLLERAVARGGELMPSTPTDPQLNEAVSYVHRAVPDALKFFGLTPESIAEKVFSKIGQLANK